MILILQKHPIKRSFPLIVFMVSLAGPLPAALGAEFFGGVANHLVRRCDHGAVSSL